MKKVKYARLWKDLSENHGTVSLFFNGHTQLEQFCKRHQKSFTSAFIDNEIKPYVFYVNIEDVEIKIFFGDGDEKIDVEKLALNTDIPVYTCLVDFILPRSRKEVAHA